MENKEFINIICESGNKDEILNCYKHCIIAEYEAKRRQIDLEFTLKQVRKGDCLAKQHLPEILEDFEKSLTQFAKCKNKLKF